MSQESQIDIYDVLDDSDFKMDLCVTKIQSFPFSMEESSQKQESEFEGEIDEKDLPTLRSEGQKSKSRASKKTWTEDQTLEFWKFYLRLAIERPYLCISWYHWKVDSIFKKMSLSIKSKNDKQCKSFDQRKQIQAEKLGQKIGKERDILDMAVLNLSERRQTDTEAAELLTKYENLEGKPSRHMEMLSRHLQRVSSQVDKIDKLSSCLNLEEQQEAASTALVDLWA